MTNQWVIYKNDGQGDLRVLPVQANDLPAEDDQAGWSALYRKLTVQYCRPDWQDRGEFITRAKATIYQSQANIWAVFGLNVRPGLDDHTIRFVRFAYRNSGTGECWLALPHPPMAMRPDIARSCVAGWTELDSLPAFDV